VAPCAYATASAETDRVRERGISCSCHYLGSATLGHSDLEFVKELSHKYDGQDFSGVIEARVIVRLTPEHVVMR
jgi:hypothetical protein